MSKQIKWSLIAIGILFAIVTSVAYLGTVTTAVHIVPISIINTGDAVNAQVVNVSLSAPNLRDNFYISSTGLNMQLHDGNTDIAFMPSSTADTTSGDQFYVFADSLASWQQDTLNLYMGGAVPFRSYHEMFVGTAGIVTTDDATMEPTSGLFYIKMDAAVQPGLRVGALQNKVDSVLLSFDEGDPIGDLRMLVTSGDGVTTDSRAVSGVTTGERTIRAIMSGDVLAMVVTGDSTVLTTADSIAFNDINDTTGAWIWGPGPGTSYMNSVEEYVTPVLDIRRSLGDWDAGTHTNTAASGDWLALTAAATAGSWRSPMIDITSVTGLQDSVMAWDASTTASNGSGGCPGDFCIYPRYFNAAETVTSSIFDVVTTNNPAPLATFATGDLTK